MPEHPTAGQDRPDFEEVYRSYPFAPLVEIGLALGAWLHRQRRENADEAQAQEPEGSGPRAHAS